MKREIKFEVIIAGNDKRKFAQFNEWLDGDGWKHDYYAPIVSNGVFHWSELGDGFLGEIIRRQYTGLKDKNGKEIYEGDILYYHFEDCPKEYVKWDIDFGCWITSENELTGDDLTDNAEIIGNIYENPELLR